MRSPLVLTLAALVFATGHTRARGQDPGALPKAETVLADFIKATGGEEAYKKCKTRSVTGTIEIPAQNVTGKIQILQAAPNLVSVMTEIPNVAQANPGDRRQGRLGANNLTGERVYEGAEKDEFLRRAVFNEELKKKELNDKIECVGIEDVEGKPAYKIVLTAKGGKKETEYYDKTTHLLVKEIVYDEGSDGRDRGRGLPQRLQEGRRAAHALHRDPEDVESGNQAQVDGSQAQHRHPARHLPSAGVAGRCGKEEGRLTAARRHELP